MRIAIATVQVPFEFGGAEFLAANLKKQLIARGHEAEIVTIPFKWYPSENLVNSMRIARMIDLTEMKGKPIDLLIGLKFPIYYTRHQNKVLWLLHQHREAYELWETGYNGLDKQAHGKLLRTVIMNQDNKYIPECQKIFTISQTVSERLKKYNGIGSVPLYHPPSGFERFRYEDVGDYVFCPARLEELKRQHLLIEAMRYTRTPVKVLLAGKGRRDYVERIQSMIETYSLGDRVHFLGWISEEEKIAYYANALAVYYGPYQEDYGYVTLEAFLSGKPVLTHVDSGGPLEFVEDNDNGFVLDSEPKLIAEKLDYFYRNKDAAREMGMNGMSALKKLEIQWDSVIEPLTNSG
jgi:glycosyltransferase involved in cell wall biosynthesis